MSDPHPISPEMLMLLGVLDALRKHFGPEACKEEWVGRLRRSAGRPLPAGIAQLPTTSPAIQEYVASRHSASAVLSLHCKTCGRCELSRE